MKVGKIFLLVLICTMCSMMIIPQNVDARSVKLMVKIRGTGVEMTEEEDEEDYNKIDDAIRFDAEEPNNDTSDKKDETPDKKDEVVDKKEEKVENPKTGIEEPIGIAIMGLGSLVLFTYVIKRRKYFVEV